MSTDIEQIPRANAGHWIIHKTNRAVWKIIDTHNQTFEMYGTHGHGGKEMKFLEIVYTRKPW